MFKAVVAPQCLAAGGTYAALRAGMSGEWAIHLSGGYHHARRDLSHGFCLINDVAVGLAKLRQEGLARRTLIYVAGSDPYIDDPLGSLQISREGMLERDRRVATFAVRLGCPLVVLPAGGYSLDSPSIAAAGFREIAALEPRGGK